jgi:hypothetical protein
MVVQLAEVGDDIDVTAVAVRHRPLVGRLYE